MEYQKAIDVFTNCIVADSLDQKAITYRAASFCNIGKYKKAFQDIQLAYEIDSTSSFLLNIMGTYYFQIDSMGLSNYYFNRALIYDPDNELAYNNLAVNAIDIEKYGLAEQYIDSALMLEPDDAGLMTNRSIIFWNLNKIDSALLELNNAIKLAKTTERKVAVLYTRGKIYQDIEEFEKAIADFTKLLMLNKNHKQTYYKRALVYVRLKEYDLALKDFKSAKKLNIDENVDLMIEETNKLKKNGG